MTPSAFSDLPLIQWLAAHWQPLVVVVVLLVVGVVIFRSTLGVYNFIFFPARAVRNAFLKALLMVALLFLIYYVPHVVFQALLPAGWLQSLSLVLSFLIQDAAWEPAGRLLDRLFIRR